MVMSSPSSRMSDLKQNRSSKKSNSRFGTAFKKVGRYLQNQAQEQSHSALYLSPPDPSRGSLRVAETSLDDDELLQSLRASQLAQPYGVVPLISSDLGTPRSSTSMAASTDAPSGPGIFKDMKRVQYASENIHQNYDVLIPPRPPPDDNEITNTDFGIFLVFIHGGYFRDPKLTSTSFKPAVATLESDASIAAQIAGYASINYRMAPHPGYPQDPSTTPPYTLNNAHWPDQPDDIQSALTHLQAAYPASKRYILIGHSVGAALSFLSVVRQATVGTSGTPQQQSGITCPLAIIGIAGIYDFPRIHAAHPDYEAMTRNAMDPAQYAEASPALYSTDDYRSKWHISESTTHISSRDTQQNNSRRVILLAHSRTDALVDWDQVEAMQDVFAASERKESKDGRDGGGGGEEDAETKEHYANGFVGEIVEIQGGHYEVLENGELARCIRRAIGTIT